MLEYQKLHSEQSRVISKLSSIVNQLSILRLALFCLGVFCNFLLYNYDVWLIVASNILFIVFFLIIIKIQSNYQLKLDFSLKKLLLIENEIDSKNVYSDGITFSSPSHPYTDDLDIFGSESLFYHINRCSTNLGIKYLATTLQKTSTKAEINKRQEAIQELCYYPIETLDFRANLFQLPHSNIDQVQNFLSNSPQYLNFLNSLTVRLLLKITPFANSALLLAGLIWGDTYWKILGITLICTAIVVIFYKSKVDKIHLQLSRNSSLLNNYAKNLSWLSSKDWRSEFLKSLTKDHDLTGKITQLTKILNNLDIRLNVIVGTFLNLFLLWDLRCLTKLKSWTLLHSHEIITSFEVIGRFEELISIANYNQQRPTWNYPIIHDDYFFEATDLGHPLINEEKRVSNNFSFSAPTVVNIITGSNMAGKSTFLRTVGINLVLASAGAKVCATTFHTGLFEIITYMRIKDSLSESTSTFKAELDRLKMILTQSSTNANALILIDEMLRGTNSKDKYLGSKAFTEKLIEQKSYLLFATHDLQIAEIESEYPGIVKNYHFDIVIENEEMKFDYKIKKGECKNFNAAILLKSIGLHINNI